LFYDVIHQNGSGSINNVMFVKLRVYWIAGIKIYHMMCLLNYTKWYLIFKMECL